MWGACRELPALSWPPALGIPAPGSFQQPRPLPPLLPWLLQHCTGLGLFFFSCFCSHELWFAFFIFFVGSKRHRVPVGGGTSTSPGVPGGASRASGAFASFPSLTLSRTGNLKRPCRVGRNQSYLLPSLLAAAVNSATEEKVKHFCFPSDPSLSALPRHVSRCPPDLSQLSASALGAVFSSGPARVSPQGKVGSAAAPKRHRGRRRCRPDPIQASRGLRRTRARCWTVDQNQGKKRHQNLSMAGGILVGVSSPPPTP